MPRCNLGARIGKEWIQIEVVREIVRLDRIRQLAHEQFGDLVKVVVDVERRVMVLGGAMHADEEALLLEDGSLQDHLWGINLYPDEYGSDDWIEFDSMINIRPSQGNRSRGVEDGDVRRVLAEIVGVMVRA